jgi:hypothetical protein
MKEMKRIIHFFSGLLACQRCAIRFDVRELNPEHRTVKCPVCGDVNDVHRIQKKGVVANG